jgi:predicted Fe-Mo cluster-binding NifX family protein
VVFGEVTVEVEGETNLKRVEFLSGEIKNAVKKEVKSLEHIIVNAKPVHRKNIKLAIPVLDREGLQAKVSEHLGTAPYFLFVEIEEGRARNWEILKNPSSNFEKKRGVKAVELIIQEKVDVLVVRSIREGPFHMLRDNFIKILRSPDEVRTVGNTLEKIGDLDEIITPVK